MKKGSIGAMDSLPTELCMVFDTVSKSYWSTDKDKTVWLTPGHAKNAWNMRRGKQNPFNKQSRFIIHVFKPNGWQLENGQLSLNL